MPRRRASARRAVGRGEPVVRYSADGALPSLCWCAAGCQRGCLRFRRAAVNASPGPPHIDTSSANLHPSSQPTPNWMRAVPADQLPDQDRPRTWWGSGSWPVLRWQRSYPPNCAPDHFVAEGKLTQAELLAWDLGHGRLLLAACPSPHAVTTPGRFSFASRVAWRG